MIGLIEMVTRVSGSAKVLTFPAGSGSNGADTLGRLRDCHGNGSSQIGEVEPIHKTNLLPDSEFTPCLYWFCGQPVSIHTGFRCAASNQIVCEVCYSTHIDGDIFSQIEPCVQCQERRERNVIR